MNGHRLGLWVGVVSCVGLGFLLPSRAAAYGTLTNLSLSSSSSTVSAAATYTVGFTTATAIPVAGGQINVQVEGVNSSSCRFTNVTLSSASSPSNLKLVDRSCNQLTLGVSGSTAIAAGTTFSIVLSSVTNPSIGGNYHARIWTTNYWNPLDGSITWGGDYVSAGITIGTVLNVTGVVDDGAGTPVPYANFQIYSSNFSVNYFGATDGNGRWGVADVPAGTYTLTIYSPSSYTNSTTVRTQPAAVTLTVGSTGVTTKNLSFQVPTKTIRGTVTKNSGGTVSDAMVYLSKTDGNGYGWANARTDSSGSFSFLVSGGSWALGLYPADSSSATWQYCQVTQTINFASDTTTESKIQNYTVQALDATLTGTIKKPNGSSPGQYSVNLSFVNADPSAGSCWYGATIDSSGKFSTKLTGGTYAVQGWSNDASFQFPTVSNIVLTAGQTTSLGTLTLVEKTDRISGTIKDNKGDPVSGASVYAWKTSGTYDWANSTSDPNGQYTLKVTPGSWSVSAWPPYAAGSQQYVTSGKPESVTVTSGVTLTQNFTFQKSTNTLTGTIVDTNGTVLTGLNGWVSASDGSQPWGNVGTSLMNGTFSLRLPSGSWDITASSYGTQYTAGDSVRITFSGDNETKSTTLTYLTNDAVVRGTVYDDTGAKVTNTWLSVYASKGYSAWQNASIDRETGGYSIAVSAGTWKLGWWVDQSLGYSSGIGQDVELKLVAGEKKTYDIVLKKASATIKGKATKADGSAMNYAWITADSRDPSEKTEATSYYYANGASSNTNGEYSIKLPPGTYWVGGSMWVGSGVINPKRQQVTVAADGTATVNLTFREANASIGGTVTLDGTASNGFVTAWSDDGGYAEANANNAGTYGLSTSKGTIWYVRALKQSGTDIYKSPRVAVDLTSASIATQNLSLSKQSYSLPNSTTTTFDPTKQQVIKLSDSTTITIPANAIASSGTLTLTAEADPTIAEQADAKPLAYGYNLKVINEQGAEVTTFPSPITIETVYQESWLTDQNVLNENELTLGYWDDSTSSWQELTTCTVNAGTNSVTCQVNHFTTFAVLAASDTTPPNPPTNLAATSLGSGKIKLSWTNSTNPDADHAIIYRSKSEGSRGDAIMTTTGRTTAEHEDWSVTDSETYFYTLTAVDTSGNESTAATVSGSVESTQASVTAVTATLPKTGSSHHSEWPRWAWLVGLLMSLRNYQWSQMRGLSPNGLLD